MKAWESQANGLAHLKRVDRPTPTPGPGELLVRVAAVSLNNRDQDIIDGNYPPEATPRPLIPVSDAAGVVAATGPGVTRFRAGDRVVTHFFSRWVDGEPGPDEERWNYGGPLDGGLAEYMIAPEGGVVAAPPGLTDAEASTLPIAALTAWFALVERGGLRPGESVLVQGTGVVALFALQLAAAMGARVLVTSGRADRLDRLRSLGAADVIDSRATPDWDQAVRELTDGRGVDHVVDIAGGASLNRSIAAARVGGRVAVVGYLAGLEATINLMPVFLRRTQIQGIAVGHRAAFERLNRFIAEHRIRPVIDSVYPFEDAIAAFERRAGGAFGKVVIAVEG